MWSTKEETWKRLPVALCVAIVLLNAVKAVPTSHIKHHSQGYMRYADGASRPDEFVLELEHLHAAAKVASKSTPGILEKQPAVELSLPSPHRPSSGQQQQPEPDPSGDEIDRDAADDVQDIRAAKPIAIEKGAISHPLRKTNSPAPVAPVDVEESELDVEEDDDDDDDHTDDSIDHNDGDENDEVSNDDTLGVEETAKIPPPKTFHGAARLTFGQNPEPAAASNQTTSTTVASTTSPTTVPIRADDAEPEGTDAKADDIEFGDAESTSVKGKRQGVFKSSPGAKIKNPEMLLERHSGGQVSSLDMAQYVFWTGDEEGVARAVEEFIHKGLMSRESAIKLLREISMGLNYLESSYSNRKSMSSDAPAEDDNHLSLHSRSSTPQMMRTTRRAHHTTSMPTTSTSTSTESATTTHSSPTSTADIELDPYLAQLRAVTRLDDANKIDNHLGHMEIGDKVRLADSLYTAYTLEETIYQLAKVMFYQSLSSGSKQGAVALQRLTAFLELESVDGRVSPMLQKRILDVLLNALSDCLAEHPDLIPAARDGLGSALDQLSKHHSSRGQLYQLS